VGDTGELDQEAGETMLLQEYPEVVKAIFCTKCPTPFQPGECRMRVVAIIIAETIKKKNNLSLSCFFHGKQAQPRQTGAIITGYANFLFHDSSMYQKKHMI
jgi:hypothetical protein